MTVTIKYFRADWCGPCSQQGPVVSELKDHFEERSDVKIEKIDVDENHEEANEYNVRSIPTIIVEKDGLVERTMHGLQGFEELKAEVDANLMTEQ